MKKINERFEGLGALPYNPTCASQGMKERILIAVPTTAFPKIRGNLLGSRVHLWGLYLGIPI